MSVRSAGRGLLVLKVQEKSRCGCKGVLCVLPQGTPSIEHWESEVTRRMSKKGEIGNLWGSVWEGSWTGCSSQEADTGQDYKVHYMLSQFPTCTATRAGCDFFGCQSLLDLLGTYQQRKPHSVQREKHISVHLQLGKASRSTGMEDAWSCVSGLWSLWG